MSKIIALLTDFGTKDYFVGVMKAVIWSITPDAKIVDITHEINPQNLPGACFMLDASSPYFPKGTIFVSVVDPGVGSSRKILCVRTKKHTFLAPDNGILSFLKKDKIISINSVTNHRYFLKSISNTFHARDIFAPVAAYLAKGVNPKRLGPKVDSIVRLKIPQALRAKDGTIHGYVIYIDRFGNLVTNIRSQDIPANPEFIIKGKVISGLDRTYSSKASGSLVAVIGSSNTVEMAVSGGNAAKKLRMKPMTEVIVRRKT